MRGPKKPSDLLGGILRQARSSSARSEVTKALAGALGDDLSPHCRVVGAKAGRVTVEVDSAPLFSELRGFRCEEIRQSMNDRIVGRKVSDLVFRMGVAGNV